MVSTLAKPGSFGPVARRKFTGFRTSCILRDSERLGLMAAVGGFCEEFAMAHEMAIEFADRSVPQVVPQDTALCLGRIIQEAPHNMVKVQYVPSSMDFEKAHLRSHVLPASFDSIGGFQGRLRRKGMPPVNLARITSAI
jgi:hypothetical protein